MDLYLRNTPLSFQNTLSVFTEFSDFPKLVLTVFKTVFVKSIQKNFLNEITNTLIMIVLRKT